MKMTTLDLEAAAFALRAYQRASELADKIDPKRTNVDDVARAFSGIAGMAKAAYWSLTGRWPTMQDSLVPLNTEHPAEWTKNVEQDR